MGVSKRDQTKVERQFDGIYRLSTAAGVKMLLGDVLTHKNHAFRKGDGNR
jgi:hypothetical protein